MPLPLTAFLARLEAAGLPVDPGRALRLRAVLDEKSGEYVGRLAELKYLLAPFVARNAKEQAEVYRIWEDFVRTYEQEWADWDETPKEEAVAGPLPWYLRYRRWLLAGVLVPILGLLAWAVWKGLVEGEIKPEPARVAIQYPVLGEFRQGDTIEIRNGSQGRMNAADSSDFRWTVYDQSTREVLHHQRSWDFRWSVTQAVGTRVSVVLHHVDPKFELQTSDSLSTWIYCSDPPGVNGVLLNERGDSLRGGVEVGQVVYIRIYEQSGEGEGESLQYTSVLEDTPPQTTTYTLNWGDDSEPQTVEPTQSYRHTFLTPGNYELIVQAERGPDADYCFGTFVQDILVQEEGKPILNPLPLQRDEAGQYLQVAGWLWGLLLLPALLSLWFWRRWRRARRSGQAHDKSEAELAAAYPLHEAGPYYIPYRAQEHHISVPADFYRIADQLRLREQGSRTQFDAAASVRATVREGGFPRWRERANKRPAEYLLILPFTTEFQQQECLLRRLADFLAEHEAAITTYYHRGDFRHFWNDDHPDGWGLGQLQSRYGEYRLILLGDGHGLIDAYETKAPRLQSDLRPLFERWQRRLLLTTACVADWSWQEELLHQHFLLFPADTEGIRRGVRTLNQTEEYEAGPFDPWRGGLTRGRPRHTTRYRSWTELADHRDYLAHDPPLFRWLCGLATVGQPDFRLTVAMGHAMGIDVTHDRLLALTRIPWLAENRPDPRLRLALLAELSPEDEAIARQAVLAELEAVSSQVAGSFAQTEWVANRAVQQFSLAPTDPGHKQTIRDLRRSGLLTGDQLEELEYEVKKQAAAQPATDNINATDQPALDRWLAEAEPRPWFTLDLMIALLLCLVSLVYCLGAWDFNQEQLAYQDGQRLSFWQTPEREDDEAVRLNNIAVLQANTLFRQSSLDTFQLRQEFWDRAMGQLEEAIELKDGDYPIADSNRYALEYNRRARYLNFYLADSLDFPAGLFEDGRGIVLTESLNALEEWLADRESPWPLQFRHAIGLMNYYLSGVTRRSGTEVGQGAIVDDNNESNNLSDPDIRNALRQLAFLQAAQGGYFFDSLATDMPVNLETILLPIILSDSPLAAFYNSLIDTSITAPILDSQQIPTQESLEQNTAEETGPGLSPDEARYRSWLTNRRQDAYRQSILYAAGEPGDNRPSLATLLNESLLRINFREPIYRARDLETELLGLMDQNYLLETGGSYDGEFIFYQGRPVVDPELQADLSGLAANTTAFLIYNHEFEQDYPPRLADPQAEIEELADRLQVAGVTMGGVLDNPTREELEELFQSLSDAANSPEGREGQVILYFSGYAFTLGNNGLLYLPSDGDTRTNRNYINLSETFDPYENDRSFKGMLIFANLHDFPNDDSIEGLPQDIGRIPQQGLPPEQDGLGNVAPIRPQMVSVPAGTFTMGDTFGEGLERELPTHQVTLSAFQLGRYEVTFDEYDRFCEDSGKEPPGDESWGRGRRPVINVSWYDAISYCNWLSQQLELDPVYTLREVANQEIWYGSNYGDFPEGAEVQMDRSANGYRLPTEAEWEYAATYTGEPGRKWRFGNGRDTARWTEMNFDAREEYKQPYSEVGEYRRQTIEVGRLGTAHPLGLHEMSGNVNEWCWDWYGEYTSSDQTNPRGPASGRRRVVRGGSWDVGPRGCRPVYRDYRRPSHRYRFIGFRLLLSPSSG